MTRGEKKLIIFTPIIIYVTCVFLTFLFLFYSCAKKIGEYNKNREERIRNNPDQYYNVKWTCTEPEIEFTIESEEYYQKLDRYGKYPEREGYMMVGEDEYQVCWDVWGKHKSIYIYRKYTKESLISGSYTFEPDSGVLTLTITEDNVFEEKYETLTFTMTKLDQ